ncbi:hypothetical protein [Lichenibacterium ramalinae]|uniref:hypothetical protein n=1 Tax=Lichenibacterium ramalinae TaxID=2316527 RepID=UPI0013EBB818|nr:hypothetical protein [Lichenibacterium ramalinae]
MSPDTLLAMTAVLAVFGPWCIGSARAEPNCMTRLLSDAPALEAPEQVKSKQSGVFGPLTQVKIEKKTGKMYYCAANSYCYGSNSFQIVTPCRLKLDKSFNFGPFFLYSAR